MNYTPFLFVCSIIVVRCFYYCAMLLLPLSQPCEYDEQNFHERRAHQPSLTSFKSSQCRGLTWQTKRTMRINWMFQGYHHCVSFHCNNWVAIRFFFLKVFPLWARTHTSYFQILGNTDSKPGLDHETQWQNKHPVANKRSLTTPECVITWTEHTISSCHLACFAN